MPNYVIVPIDKPVAYRIAREAPVHYQFYIRGHNTYNDHKSKTEKEKNDG